MDGSWIAKSELCTMMDRVLTHITIYSNESSKDPCAPAIVGPAIRDANVDGVFVPVGVGPTRLRWRSRGILRRAVETSDRSIRIVQSGGRSRPFRVSHHIISFSVQ